MYLCIDGTISIINIFSNFILANKLWFERTPTVLVTVDDRTGHTKSLRFTRNFPTFLNK